MLSEQFLVVAAIQHISCPNKMSRRRRHWKIIFLRFRQTRLTEGSLDLAIDELVSSVRDQHHTYDHFA